MKIVSFDVGLRTCSVCIEDYDDEILNQIEFPVKKDRYHKDGSATDPMKESIRQASIIGNILHLDKRDLGEKIDYFAGESFLELYNWLFEMNTQKLFNDVTVVIIEQQMNTNFIALALMHHIYAWWLIQYQRLFPVILFPARNKTRILGQQLKKEDGTMTSKYERKKWSYQQIDILLQERHDTKHHDLIFKENSKKKDDLSDCINQSRSYVVNELIKQQESKNKKSKK